MSVDHPTLAGRSRRAAGWLFAMILIPVVAVAALPSTVARAAGSATFSNAAPIITTDGTTAPFVAGLYPSPITVSGMTGLITSMSITLDGVTATTAGDLDALLVSPGGSNLVVISDIGPNNSYVSASNATLTLADGGSPFPAAPGATVASGTYAPIDNDAGLPADVFPAPAPAATSSTSFATAFAGSNPNGTWNLYVVDDATGDPVSITGGWSLTIASEAASAATTTSLVSSGNPSMLGTPVSFTATVRSDGQLVTAGSVTITAAGQTKTAAVNSSGQASAEFASLPEGTYPVRANYGGATGFAPSSDALTQVVDRATTVNGSSYCNTGPITIPDQGTATPYPSRLSVTGQVGQLSDVRVRLLGVTHSSLTDLDILLVGPDPSHNLILLSDVPTNAGITDADLTFSDAATTTLGNAPVSGTYRPSNGTGADTFPAPAPTPSSATQLATFDGSSPNGTWSLYVVDDASGDSGTISGGWCVDLTTVQATTTTLTAAANPVEAGQPTTLTATVTAGGAAVPQGGVTFTIDGTPAATSVPVDSGGKATVATSSLAVGTHTVSASYDGTGGYLTSSSAPLSLSVTTVATSTQLTADPPAPVVNGPVTLTATVLAHGTGVTSGTVTFTVGGTAHDVSVAASGVATYTFTPTAAGSTSVTADYRDAQGHYASSSAPPLTLTTDALATTLTLTGPSGTLSYGESATVTASVSQGSTPVTAGLVRFSIGSTVLADVPVAGGAATYTLSNLAVGEHTVTATYLGTTTFAGSSDSLTLTVEPLATSITITPSPVSPPPGEMVHYLATITHLGSPVTAGTAQLSVDGAAMGGPTQVTPAGVATWAISGLAVGVHTIRVDYDGTQGWAGSWTEITQFVNPVADAGGPYTVAEGQSLTLDASGSTPGATIGWDLNGDGDFTDATGVAPVLAWAELETYGIDDGPASVPISVRVTAAGRTSTATTTLTVVNAPPTVSVSGSLTATAGVPFTIKISALDPSAADAAAPFRYTVDWGDGSPLLTVSGPADPPVTHTYTEVGTYTAFATATDKDGGGSSGLTITVLAKAAPAEPTTAPPSTAPPSTASPTTTAPTTAPPTTSGPVRPPTTPPALAGTGAGPLLVPVGLAAVALLLLSLVLIVPRRRGRHR